jgi:cell division protein FtsQ
VAGLEDAPTSAEEMHDPEEEPLGPEEGRGPAEEAEKEAGPEEKDGLAEGEEPGSGGDEPGRNGIDPRLAERRTAVIREQGRKRLRVLIVGAAVIVVVVGGWFLLHSAVFSARSISVTGNVHETASQVAAQAGLAGHPPLLDVNTAAAASRIERMPWVQTASVNVSWPDSVHIVVTEEKPRFVAREPGGSWAWLDANGRVLEVSRTRPTQLLLLSVPIAPRGPGTRLAAQDQVGLRVATTLPRSFASQVTGVTIEPGGWVQLTMTTPVLVDIGSTAQLPAKYEDVSSILAGATLHNGDVIDVSVPDAPTVTAA